MHTTIQRTNAVRRLTPRAAVSASEPRPAAETSAGEPCDLEGIADRMLESVGALGAESGIYTRRQLRRKKRLEWARVPKADPTGIPEATIGYIVQRQVDELVDVSRLTPRQEVVYRLYAHGLDCRCIGATLRIGRQRAARCLRAAKRRVRAAIREGRYAGWYEVYLSEVNRPAYRRRR